MRCPESPLLPIFLAFPLQPSVPDTLYRLQASQADDNVLTHYEIMQPSHRSNSAPIAITSTRAYSSSMDDDDNFTMPQSWDDIEGSRR